MSFDLPKNLSLTAHAGYNFGDYFDAFELSEGVAGDYSDYSLALEGLIGRFAVSLAWVRTDITAELRVDDGAWRNDDRLIWSVATGFPKP